MNDQQERIRRLRIAVQTRIQEIEAHLEEKKNELQNTKNELAALVSSCRCPDATRKTITPGKADYMYSCPDCGRLFRVAF